MRAPLELALLEEALLEEDAAATVSGTLEEATLEAELEALVAATLDEEAAGTLATLEEATEGMLAALVAAVGKELLITDWLLQLLRWAPGAARAEAAKPAARNEEETRIMSERVSK